MTLNQIIGNKERKSRIDTKLWKKMNEKYSGIKDTKEEKIPTENNLEQKIKYVDDKPKIKIIPMEKTIVHTQTQKEYDTLMQISESAGYTFYGNILSTTKNLWTNFKEYSCFNIKPNIMLNRKPNYVSERYKIILMQEFYDIQNIKPENIKKLNEYYNKNNPNRASKG